MIVSVDGDNGCGDAGEDVMILQLRDQVIKGKGRHDW